MVFLRRGIFDVVSKYFRRLLAHSGIRDRPKRPRHISLRNQICAICRLQERHVCEQLLSPLWPWSVTQLGQRFSVLDIPKEVPDLPLGRTMTEYGTDRRNQLDLRSTVAELTKFSTCVEVSSEIFGTN